MIKGSGFRVPRKASPRGWQGSVGGARLRRAFGVCFLVLAAAAATAFAITIGWDHDAIDTVEHFTVYEHAPPNYNSIGSVAAPMTTFELPYVFSPGPHNFVVSAWNPAGESAFSNELTINFASPTPTPTPTATPLGTPGAPQNLRVIPSP